MSQDTQASQDHINSRIQKAQHAGFREGRERGHQEGVIEEKAHLEAACQEAHDRGRRLGYREGFAEAEKARFREAGASGEESTEAYQRHYSVLDPDGVWRILPREA